MLTINEYYTTEMKYNAIKMQRVMHEDNQELLHQVCTHGQIPFTVEQVDSLKRK